MSSKRYGSARSVESPPAIETATITRTLLAAGFRIKGVQRQPDHIEYQCDRPDQLGIHVPYLVVVFASAPSEAGLDSARRRAERNKCLFVGVSEEGGRGLIAWSTFLDALGGAVPSWRALGSEYGEVLRTSGRNAVPPGLAGEAWQIFEDAVADGLEFLLGKPVQRLGGRKRGRPVSDLLACTPDQSILVIDTKASTKAFEVGVPELRPLEDYAKRQSVRQTGGPDVSGVLLAAASFAQDERRLEDLAKDFLSSAKVPLTFLEAENLVRMVDSMRNKVRLRNTIRWARILCAGGLVSMKRFDEELEATASERYSL